MSIRPTKIIVSDWTRLPPIPNNIGPYWKKEDYREWDYFAVSPGAKKVKSFSGYTAQLLGLRS